MEELRPGDLLVDEFGSCVDSILGSCGHVEVSIQSLQACALGVELLQVRKRLGRVVASKLTTM